MSPVPPATLGDRAAGERVMSALDKLPPFSPVLNKVLATLASEQMSLGDLAAIIETDTVLAGSVLRVVNSPLYGRRATINSVKHAVVLIGIMKVRNLVLGLSVSRRWAGAQLPKCWSPRQFNLHSLAVAVLADQLALDLPVNYPEGAFVAGLMHDIGKLLLAIGSAQEYSRVQAEVDAGAPVEETEHAHFGLTHAEVSALVLERWNLPHPIREAGRWHHSPGAADAGRLHLAHLIQAADAWVTANGVENHAYHQPLDPAARDALEQFGLWSRIERAKEVYEAELQAICAVM